MRMFITVQQGLSLPVTENQKDPPLDVLGRVQITNLANSICHHVTPGEKIKVFHSGSRASKESAALLAHYLPNADYLEDSALTLGSREPKEQLRRTHELLLFAKEEGLGHVGIFITEEKLAPLIIPHYLKVEYNLDFKHKSTIGFGRGVGVNSEHIPTTGKSSLRVSVF